MYVEKSCLDILNETDSSSPTPGGGSISALVGALGICLSRMYAHLTVNKKKFLALDESIQSSFLSSFHELENYKNRLIECVDKDCEAYDAFMSAYRLPKNSNEEIEVRRNAIYNATLIAIESPYNIMVQSLKAIELCNDLIEHGNINAISDLACGVIFLDAAIQGAALNVQINLNSLENDLKEEWTFKMNDVLNKSNELKESIVNKIKIKL